MSEDQKKENGAMVKCPECSAGYSATYEALKPHVNKLVWDRATERDDAYATITEFLCGRSPKGRPAGHDSADAWAAVLKLGELAGLPEGWHRCKRCNGEAEIEEAVNG